MKRVSSAKSGLSFGQRLLRFRKAARLSRLALAARVGVVQSMVAYWERVAKRPPPPEQVEKLAAALGITSTDLLGATEPPDIPTTSQAKAVKLGEEPFGRRLARLRKAAGFSQQAFGAAVGLSQRMVTYWEQEAQRPPPADQLAKMATVLGISTDELLGVTEPSPDAVLKRHPILQEMRLVEKLPRPAQKLVRSMIRGLAREHGIPLNGDGEKTAPPRAASIHERPRRRRAARARG